EFLDAQRRMASVSPFPLVWLYFQQGLMWQNAGRFARARDFFDAAHERLPTDVAVTAHLAATLAATGERDRAIALLRPTVAALAALVRPSAHLHVLASRAFDACGKKDRAAAELAAAGKPGK